MASFKPFCWGPRSKRYPILDLGLVEGPAGYRLHPNPKLGARRKVKWEKTENCTQTGVFRPKLMASFKPFCWGPRSKRYPILDLGLVEGPAGYRLHPNPKLGARRKVKWEKIESLPPNWRFSPKIDGLL